MYVRRHPNRASARCRAAEPSDVSSDMRNAVHAAHLRVAACYAQWSCSGRRRLLGKAPPDVDAVVTQLLLLYHLLEAQP
jgi:hypothetical protein